MKDGVEEGEEDDGEEDEHNNMYHNDMIETVTEAKDGNLKDKTTEDEDPPVVVLYDTEKDLSSKTFVCIYCNKHFETRYQLKRHLLTHSGKRQHVCTICQAAFVLSSSLWHHMQTHSTRKNHICVECGQAFLRSTGLRLHRKTHTSSKDHICNICGQAFHQKGNLKAHINAHRGIKPYQCTECGQSYSQLSNMKRHMWTHHQQKKVFSCSLCKAAFEKHKELRIHQQLSHKPATPTVTTSSNHELHVLQLIPTKSSGRGSPTDWHELLPSITTMACSRSKCDKSQDCSHTDVDRSVSNALLVKSSCSRQNNSEIGQEIKTERPPESEARKSNIGQNEAQGNNDVTRLINNYNIRASGVPVAMDPSLLNQLVSERKVDSCHDRNKKLIQSDNKTHFDDGQKHFSESSTVNDPDCLTSVQDHYLNREMLYCEKSSLFKTERSTKSHYVSVSSTDVEEQANYSISGGDKTIRASRDNDRTLMSCCPSVTEPNILCVPSQTRAAIPLLQHTIPLYMSVTTRATSTENPLLLNLSGTAAFANCNRIGRNTACPLDTSCLPTITGPVPNHPVPLYTVLDTSTNTSAHHRSNKVSMTAMEAMHLKDVTTIKDAVPSVSLPWSKTGKGFSESDTTFSASGGGSTKCSSDVAVASSSPQPGIGGLVNATIKSGSDACQNDSSVPSSSSACDKMIDTGWSAFHIEHTSVSRIDSFPSSYTVADDNVKSTPNTNNNAMAGPTPSDNIISSISNSEVKPSNSLVMSSLSVTTPRASTSNMTRPSSSNMFSVLCSVNHQATEPGSNLPSEYYIDGDIVVPVSVTINGYTSTVFMLACTENQATNCATSGINKGSCIHSSHSSVSWRMTQSRNHPVMSLSSNPVMTSSELSSLPTSKCGRGLPHSVTLSDSPNVTMGTTEVTMVREQSSVAHDVVVNRKQLTQLSSKARHRSVIEEVSEAANIGTSHAVTSAPITSSRQNYTKSSTSSSSTQHRTSSNLCPSSHSADLPDVTSMLHALNTQVSKCVKLLSLSHDVVCGGDSGTKHTKVSSAGSEKSTLHQRSQFRCLPGGKDITMTMYTPESRTPTEFIIRGDRKPVGQAQKER
ncbi:hypothetical protein LSH36_99g07024 [Paralvinella palmiformis]|uniref:C2H2-type domain-containing protein n=1 Tax=Paralvinella palmiformis TaxID=53620 RepID=A0AAD9JZN0_9ANNE|nr:hypothetical protein LSH36_99g07024 [Paralvinella palmiformis]